MISFLVFAHGIGGRLDLPLSKWQVAWSGTVAIVFSFVALGFFWHKPLLRKLTFGQNFFNINEEIPKILKFIGRVLSLVLFLLVLVAGFIGQDNTVANIAPVTVFIVFWIGMSCISVLFGNVWKAVSPWESLGLIVDRVRPASEQKPPIWLSTGWAALIPISIFHWFELAYHDGASPRILGWWILIYTLGLLAMAWKWGWVHARKAEGFGVLFGLLAELSPFFLKKSNSRDKKKEVRARLPFFGVSSYQNSSSELAVLLAALGGTAFDGFSRTRFWGEIIVGRSAWELTFVNTIGLVWIVVVVGAAYHFAGRMGSLITQDRDFSDRFGVSLIPILFGYDIAHYLSLLLLEGQAFKVLISDPFGRGWNLFGTATDAINWTFLSTGLIGWTQICAIVGGHLIGVLVSHDRAVENFKIKEAMRSQYPMLAVMVFYTICGLVLMTG